MSEPVENLLRRWWPMIVTALALAASWGMWTAELRTLSTQMLDLKAHYLAIVREDRDVIVRLVALEHQLNALREEIMRREAQAQRRSEAAPARGGAPIATE